MKKSVIIHSETGDVFQGIDSDGNARFLSLEQMQRQNALAPAFTNARSAPGNSGLSPALQKECSLIAFVPADDSQSNVTAGQIENAMRNSDGQRIGGKLTEYSYAHFLGIQQLKDMLGVKSDKDGQEIRQGGLTFSRPQVL